MGHLQHACVGRVAALSEDPQKALLIANTIPITQRKAEVSGSVARAVAEKIRPAPSAF